jgi:hypothetical protein
MPTYLSASPAIAYALVTYGSLPPTAPVDGHVFEVHTGQGETQGAYVLTPGNRLLVRASASHNDKIALAALQEYDVVRTLDYPGLVAEGWVDARGEVTAAGEKALG